MRYIQTKFAEKTKRHFMFTFFPPENCAVYEIMWKHMVGPDRPQMKIHRKHAHCMMDKQV